MKYCPNAGCAYAVRFKRPAEFRDDLETCTECGAALGAAPVRVEAPAPPRPPSDAGRRLAVTVGAGIATWALGILPLYGAPHGLMRAEVGSEGPRALSFGLTPFLTGFLLVEVVAVLVPGLRARRLGGFSARRPLLVASLAVGALMLLLQTANMVRALDSSMGPYSDAPLSMVVWPVWTVVLLAHLALLVLVFVISRWGLGNGFAVVTAVSCAEGLAESTGRLVSFVRTGVVAAGPLLLLVAALAGVAVLTVRFAFTPRGPGNERPSSAPFPISGLGMFAAGVALVSLPITFGLPFSHALMSSTALYYGLTTFLGLDLCLGLGFAFFRPAAVGRLWRRWLPSIDETGVVAQARALLPRALALAVGAAVLVPAAMALWISFFGVRLQLATLEWMVLVLVIVDLREEYRARARLGFLTAVRPVQRMAEVEPVLVALAEAGIEAHAQSCAYRATQQFFGPQVPVVILVPRGKAEDALRRLDVV